MKNLLYSIVLFVLVVSCSNAPTISYNVIEDKMYDIPLKS